MCCFAVTGSEILHYQVTRGRIDRSACMAVYVLSSLSLSLPLTCPPYLLPVLPTSTCSEMDVHAARCPSFQDRKALSLFLDFKSSCWLLSGMFFCILKWVFLISVHLFFSPYCVPQTTSSLKSITVLLPGLPNTVAPQFVLPQFLLWIWYWPEKRFMQNALNVLCFVFL